MTPTALLTTTCKASNIRMESKPLPPVSSTGEGPNLHLRPESTYQTFRGFGAALTEASTHVLSQLSEEKAKEVLNACFDPEHGNGYRFCRLHLNSCDFSLGNWACNAVEGDVDQKSFDMSRYDEGILPFLRIAQEAAGVPLQLLVSPWSPPAWMKSNGQMNQGGKLLPQYRKAWARNYARFALEMDARGFPLWGFTIQNEPDAVQTWDSCIYSAQEEAEFLRDDLAPVLEEAGLGHLRLILWDHNKDLLLERASVLENPGVAEAAWGVGFHWYAGEHPDQMDEVHRRFPAHELVFTEGCWEGGVKLGKWDRGERYAASILNDLNHWTTAWIDWNLLLDETGGPNHVGNLCDAPIIGDTKKGSLTYQTSYHYIGHFSRFIKPGAVRIQVEADPGFSLPQVAFLNPDHSLAVVILNDTEKTEELTLTLKDQTWKIEIPARGIVTAVIS